MSDRIKDIRTEIRRLLREYDSLSGNIKREKKDYLDEMETAPAGEDSNPVLLAFLEDKKKNAVHSAEAVALHAYFGPELPKRAKRRAAKETEKYKELLAQAAAELAAPYEAVQNPQDLSKRDLLEFRKRLNYSFQSKMTEERASLKQRIKDACAELIEAEDIEGVIESDRVLIDSTMEDMIDAHFRYLRPATFGYLQINSDTLSRYIALLTDRDEVLSRRYAKHIVFGGNPSFEYVIRLLEAKEPSLKSSFQLLKEAKSKASVNVRDLLRNSVENADELGLANAYRVGRSFTKERMIGILAENPFFSEVAREYVDRFEQENRIKNGLLDAIPDTYPELFPLARQIKRRFVLHIGPTNSGKSYDAVNALKEARTGIYLAPLRLLAFEKFEELNTDGYPCTLKTGEEEIGIPFANLQSSTIEVLDFTTRYDVAVIDEGQMIADSQRGSAWTFAILGVRARVVHICLAPEAEKAIISIIKACGDSYETVRHERLVPLRFEKHSPVEFPTKVKRGTAFIVFSRKAVHAAAGELQRNGYKCSVIYGALPYDVRRNEVKRYTSGETDIVVATDAIGMGLNLPIERIIFLEMDKFDGVERRPLTVSEIKQISGRAGRYQMFDVGLVSSEEFKHQVAKALTAEIPQIEAARIGFPYSLLGIEGSVSQLMIKWGEIETKPGFIGADLSREIALAQELEQDCGDKELVYSFVMIPFDEKQAELKVLWKELFTMEARDLKRRYMEFLPPEPNGDELLDELEYDFKVCDLLYHYTEKFISDSADDLRAILSRKDEISAVIMDKLSKERLKMRSCKVCGKPLPFLFKYSVCERCFRRGKRSHEQY